MIRRNAANRLKSTTAVPIFLVLGVVFVGGSHYSPTQILQRVKIRIKKTPTMIGMNIFGRQPARWLVAVVWAWCGGVTSVNAGGYLPRLGPVSLLYQAPPSAIVAVLPPLLMQDQPSPVVAPASVVEQKNSKNTIPARLAAPPPRPATNAPVVPAVIVPIAPPPAEAVPGPNELSIVPASGSITPQMLVRYFDAKGGTNQQGGLVVPFIFTPPQPPGRASSSTATFIKE